jgi:hypothetical protein
VFLRALRGVLIFAIAATAVGCGKKGPPLPPLVKIPVAPADFVAERRGDEVTIQFTVPAANTDNTKPANIERVDVYALTAPASVSDDLLLKRGTVVGSVDVKAPADPDQAVDADEPDADAEPPEGKGLDQGAAAHVDDQLTAAAMAPPNLASGSRRSGPPPDTEGPLVGPAFAVASRVYAGVGVNKRGRKGAVSRRAIVPLVPPPPPPPAPTIAYDEKAVHVAWDAAPTSAMLPSHPLGIDAATLAYNVYDVPPAGDGSSTAGQRLNKAPTADRSYDDPRMDWGKERCYAIRAVAVYGNLTVESSPSPPACKTLTDTFPPAAPHGLRAVGTEAAVNLIWDPNGEADLAGYLVLRGTSPDALEPVTPAPIGDTTYRDTVQPGIRYVYAVVAVDKAGNRSAPSERVEESAR